ncbi:hypothetical protein DFH06DRAFT_44391 [Mycena polygramma]|nr:hypothetical protein DFH06DRAFT_44391 [Mycena polygramma]
MIHCENLSPHAEKSRWTHRPTTCSTSWTATRNRGGLLRISAPNFSMNIPQRCPLLSNTPMNFVPPLSAPTMLAWTPRLEWLGDAMIEAAMFCCVYDSNARACAPVNTHFVKQLVDPKLLAHLALLYGVQLHDFIPSGSNRTSIPSVARVCDSFEAVVGANVVEFDFEGTLQWLGPLLDPWVQLFPGPPTGSAFVSSDARTKYHKTIRAFDGVPVAPPRPATLEADSFTSIGSVLPQLSAHDILFQLGTRGPAWPDVDATGVTFPLGYPPAPPRLAEVDSVGLAAEMTDIGYHLEFGSDFTPNTGYHDLGLRLCKLAVTILTYKKFYSATPAEMVTI